MARQSRCPGRLTISAAAEEGSQHSSPYSEDDIIRDEVIMKNEPVYIPLIWDSNSDHINRFEDLYYSILYT